MPLPLNGKYFFLVSVILVAPLSLTELAASAGDAKAPETAAAGKVFHQSDHGHPQTRLRFGGSSPFEYGIDASILDSRRVNWQQSLACLRNALLITKRGVLCHVRPIYRCFAEP